MRRQSVISAPPCAATGTGAGGAPRACSAASLALLRGVGDAPGPVHCGVPPAMGTGAGGPPSSARWWGSASESPSESAAGTKLDASSRAAAASRPRTCISFAPSGGVARTISRPPEIRQNADLF